VLGFSLRAATQGARLTGGEWVTLDPPRRPVSLACVMTTFRREKAAAKVIDVFVRDVLGSDTGVSHLFVIDNGRSLEVEPRQRVTVVPSKNLGGAGGFARGLLLAQEGP